MIDGEIVIATRAGLDFDALQLRLHPAASSVAKLAEETPASFVAFDMLAAAARPDGIAAGRDVGPTSKKLSRSGTAHSSDADDARAFARGDVARIGSKAPAWTASWPNASICLMSPGTDDAQDQARSYRGLRRCRLSLVQGDAGPGGLAAARRL